MATMSRRRSTGGPERALARWAVVPAALALVLAMPVATWWLVGDLSTVPLSASPDYAFHPWAISPAAARATGTGSLVVAAVMVVVLAWATLRRLLDIRWWGGAGAASGRRFHRRGGVAGDDRWSDRREYRSRMGHHLRRPNIPYAPGMGSGHLGVPVVPGKPRQDGARQPGYQMTSASVRNMVAPRERPA
jgi:hypothetical protein